MISRPIERSEEMRKSTLPIYLQIHNQLRQEIEEGKWEVGDKLPAERELALHFNVSRMTLRQAVQTLADEGILERKIGSGTYVAPKKVSETLVGTTSFSEIIRAQGKTPSSLTIAYFVTTPNSIESEKLQLEKDDRILRMERVRFADGVPICFEITSIPQKLVAPFDKEEITQALYQTLKQKGGYTIAHSQQTISATLANEKMAEHLSIKRGEAMLQLRQISYFDNEQPFELVRSFYVGDRFEFVLSQ